MDSEKIYQQMYSFCSVSRAEITSPRPRPRLPPLLLPLRRYITAHFLPHHIHMSLLLFDLSRMHALLSPYTGARNKAKSGRNRFGASRPCCQEGSDLCTHFLT